MLVLVLLWFCCACMVIVWPLVCVVLVAFHVASVARVRVLCGSVIGNGLLWPVWWLCVGSVAVLLLCVVVLLYRQQSDVALWPRLSSATVCCACMVIVWPLVVCGTGSVLRSQCCQLWPLLWFCHRQQSVVAVYGGRVLVLRCQLWPCWCGSVISATVRCGIVAVYSSLCWCAWFCCCCRWCVWYW